VILSRDADLVDRMRAACGCAAVDVVGAASAYEAAAEILDGGAAVIVVDFRALGKAHVRLLDVARGRGVEMFGVGPLPAGATAGQLSRMRLVTKEDLAAALAGVLQRRPEAAAPARPRLTAKRRSRTAERGARKKARRVPRRLSAGEESGSTDAGALAPPAPVFSGENKQEESVDRMEEYSSTEDSGEERQAASRKPTASRDADGGMSRAASHASAPAPAPAGATRSLLTPEELTALLEDRP
jgi:hypothetical protein